MKPEGVSLPAVHWVFFDLGSTLVNEEEAEAHYQRDVYQLLRRYGAELDWGQYVTALLDLVAKRVARGHRELTRGLFRRHAKSGTLQEFLEEFSDRWSLDYYTGFWKLHEDVIPALEEASARYPCGIIANQASGVRRVIEKLGIAPYFKAIFLSGDMGYAKPDQRFFLHALQKVNVAPQKAVYVGDRVDLDMAPANALGMTTIRIKRISLFSSLEPQEEVEEPRYQITDLRELTQILLS